MPKTSPAKVGASHQSEKSGSVLTPTLLILMMVMVVNALAYGIIIPLLYPYAERFGINPVGLGWLFASFSLAQLISTPIIGRLSDKYGRKPLLLFCLLGTSLSLALFASAQSIVVLFLARMIDGVTGGNNSVAQAIIADSTKGADRAKAFGFVGAAFGFGFLFGPALGGLLSQFGLTVPFWFAAGLGLLGTILGAIFLPETLKKADAREAKRESLFTANSLKVAFFSGPSALVLWLSLVVSIALNVFILGFQTFTVDILAMNSRDVGLLFAAFGLVSMLMQVGGIKYLLAFLKSKKVALSLTLALCALVMVVVSTTRTPLSFGLVLFFFMAASAPHFPMISALLSERTHHEDQGGILGLNQAVVSLGQIVGPLLAGLITTRSVPLVFVVAGVLYALGTLVTLPMYSPVKRKADL